MYGNNINYATLSELQKYSSPLIMYKLTDTSQMHGWVELAKWLFYECNKMVDGC